MCVCVCVCAAVEPGVGGVNGAATEPTAQDQATMDVSSEEDPGTVVESDESIVRCPCGCNEVSNISLC